MTRVLYSLAVFALLPWAVLHLLWRARRQPAYLRHWRERFARYRQSAVSPAPTFWIHAVSVGETRAAQPLIAALTERYPGARIVITHMTPTGRETSTALFGDHVERLYLPYDTPAATRRFLRRYRPRAGLIMETELWPNLIASCQAERIPLLLVNARLSPRSARRYARFPTLTRAALHGLSDIGAQTNDDATRLLALGAKAVTLTGNMKFDIQPPPAQQVLGQTFRAQLQGRSMFLAASTREGEEDRLFSAWRKLGAVETLRSKVVGQVTPSPLRMTGRRFPAPTPPRIGQPTAGSRAASPTAFRRRRRTRHGSGLAGATPLRSSTADGRYAGADRRQHG